MCKTELLILWDNLCVFAQSLRNLRKFLLWKFFWLSSFMTLLINLIKLYNIWHNLVKVVGTKKHLNQLTPQDLLWQYRHHIFHYQSQTKLVPINNFAVLWIKLNELQKIRQKKAKQKSLFRLLTFKRPKLFQ